MFSNINSDSKSLQYQYMDTHDVPESKRFRVWHEMINTIFPRLQIKQAKPCSDFQASASVCRFDQHVLAMINTADAVYHFQGAHHDDVKPFWLCLYFPITIHGETTHFINQKQIKTSYSAGDFYIFDERYEFAIKSSAGKGILWQFSIENTDHEKYRVWQQLNPELATALIRQHNLFPLLQQHLFELQRIIKEADEASLFFLFQCAIQILEEILQNILSAMVQKDDLEGMAATHYRGLYFAAEQYILDQMSRPLKPEDLSDALGTSRATLFRAFTHCNTTPYQHIIRLKLEKLHQLLSKKSFANQHISTLVYQCGFNNIDQAGKLFKRHYGVSMSSYRKQIQHESSEP
ncbi:helix-turn-helix domain-containing protein [Cardiobacteriaceae bacterium TAE3-ERU3]|nr:helix-turn-helix domain-containing protein [Cardiobacteriaceae bacterium TAE3-ERU3]